LSHAMVLYGEMLGEKWVLGKMEKSHFFRCA